MNTTLQRKKSLPDVQQLPYATNVMSREEVSMLGSARREEVRRQIDESERLKANPLLYLVSPTVKVGISYFVLIYAYFFTFFWSISPKTEIQKESIKNIQLTAPTHRFCITIQLR